MASKPRLFRIIGITGPIASGKTVARTFFEERGYAGIDADSEAKALYSDPDVRRRVSCLVGPEAYGLDGVFLPSVVRRRAFADATLLKRLEAILYPLLEERIEALLARARSEGFRGAVLEAVNLTQLPAALRCDPIIAVVAERETQIERLSAKGLAFGLMLNIFAAQPTARAFADRASVVIENNASLDAFFAELGRVASAYGLV